MFDFEKLFPALLVAGIVAMISGFIADVIIHPHDLEKDAVSIAGTAVAAGAISAPKGPDPIQALLASADLARGQKLTKACAACHSFDKGGSNGLGPNLWGVVGAAKAHHAGFSYSSALQEKGGKWDYDSLNHFLYKPKAYVSGTKMSYAGLKKTEDRAAVIAYLRSLSDAPIALPAGE